MAEIQSTKSKQKKVRTLHQKSKVFRSGDPITSVLMWGVNYTVRAPLARADRS